MYSCNLKRTMFIVLLKYSPLVQILLYLLSFQKHMSKLLFLLKKSLEETFSLLSLITLSQNTFCFHFSFMVMRLFLFKSCLMNHPTSPHVLFELFLMLSEFVPLHKEVLNSMITVPFGLYRFHFLLLLSCLDSSIPDISLQNSLVVSVIPD